MDRTEGEMRLYLDGVERAVGALPAGFGALAYSADNSIATGGLWDELRISSTAHTAEKIWQDFCGEHPYEVTAVSPRVIHTGPESPATQNFIIDGFQIGETNAQLLQGGQPADIALAISDRSYGRVALAALPGPLLLLGPAQIAISSPGSPDTSADMIVVTQSTYPVDADTLLLWRLDESANGSTTLLDSGPFNLQGSSAPESQATAGRFQGGRQLAAAESVSDAGRLQFGASSFSVDFWMKTGAVPDIYTLVARTTPENLAEFDVSILRSGSLRVRVFDSARTLWQAETRLVEYDETAGWASCVVDDDKWHSVSVVVDRGTSILSVYVDGLLRRSVAAPAGFGAVGSPAGKLRAGHYGGTSTSYPRQFPGILDDIRISSGAHSPEQIWGDYSGIW